MAAIDINRTTTISLPGAVSRDILQKTQEASAVMALARRIALPGLGVTIPVITGDPEAGWVGETEKKPVKRGTLATKVMQPYTLVKDHRTGQEISNVNSVLDGNIDPFINAYLKWITVKPEEE